MEMQQTFANSFVPITRDSGGQRKLRPYTFAIASVYKVGRLSRPTADEVGLQSETGCAAFLFDLFHSSICQLLSSLTEEVRL